MPRSIQVGGGLLLAVAFSSLGLAPEDGQGGEALLGSWRLMVVEIGGMRLPEDQVRSWDHVVTFDGARFRGTSAYGATEGSYEWDASHDPMHLQFRHNDDPQRSQPCIFRIEDDRLTICSPQVGGRRPEGFASKAGSGDSLGVYRRVK